MKKEDLKYLTDLRQALGAITTSNSNTVIMGHCLESLDVFIENIAMRLIEQEKNENKEE